jgi:hypothetical protein
MEPLSRRDLLIAAGSLSLAQSALAQPGVAFVVTSSPLALSLTDPVGIAVAASAPCTIDVTFGDGPRTLSDPVSFNLKDGRTAYTTRKFSAGSVKALVVQLRVTPVSGRPSVSAMIEPGAKSGQPASTRAAENAFFVKNPAAAPGSFGIQLPYASDVKTTITPAASSQPIVKEKIDPNVPTGPARIPWDLTDNGGARVPAGEYSATLLATPKVPKLDETVFLSSVRVLNP